jgi:hypothetical protein
MICREFTRKAEEFTLAELSNAADPQLREHERECASCADWLQQRHALAGAMQALRSSTAAVEAPMAVEHSVLRSFRQSVSVPERVEASAVSQPFAFQLSRFFGWGAYAATAAALAISLGLGIWFLTHSQKAGDSTAQHKTTSQPVQASTQPEKVAQAPVRTQSSAGTQRMAKAAGSTSSGAVLTPVQAEQAQGYTPMMLCDPLSCSGDEQVVRMQLPASDGSQEAQMADVIIGDDGLVRAIRIIQQ